MNSSSRVPPRFVPTLTEVVPTVADADADADATDGQAVRDAVSGTAPNAAPDPAPDNVAPMLTRLQAQERAPLAARASFHSPWLADGLYVRSKPATIPCQLPPLPESLPPQQPFAVGAGMNVAAGGTAEMPEPTVPQAVEQRHVPPAAQALGSQDRTQGPTRGSAAETMALEGSSDLPAADEVRVPVTELAGEELLHHLVQRVQLALEKRLPEMVEQVVQAQAHSLALRLREELEPVVRRAIHDAVESELELQAPSSRRRDCKPELPQD